MSTDTTPLTQTRPRRAQAVELPRQLLASPVRRPVRRGSPFQRVSARARWQWLVGDAVALVALLAALLVALLPSFGWGWVAVTVAGFGVVGMAIGWLGARFGLNSAVVLAAMVVAWFSLGTFLIMPSSGLGQMVPTMRSLRGLATGPVTAPKAMLTLDPPIGETWNLLTVPALLALVGWVAAVSISLRSRRPALAWIPPVLAIGVAWALGTSVTFWPVITSVAVVAVVLVWTSARRRMIRQTLVAQQRRGGLGTVLLGAGVIAVAGAVTAVAAAPLAASQPRLVARQAVAPPLDLHTYTSPLQSMRGVVSLHGDDVQLSVQGAPGGSVVRIATLDNYDGLSFTVSTSTDQAAQNGQFRRIGSRIVDHTGGLRAPVSISLVQYDSVWVPTVGQSTSLRVDGPQAVAVSDSLYYNKASGTAISTFGVKSGDVVHTTAVVPVRPSDDQITAAAAGQVSQPALVTLPDSIKDLATTWTQGSATKGAAALQLERQLKQGYFSNGLPNQTPSLPGHSLGRLDALLARPTQMVGDEEQYATVMALMARQLGIPARVVYGYRTGESGSGDLRGRDVGAWTELNLSGLGWVMFNPTPDHQRTLKNQTQDPPPKPRPHVDNPPPVPKKPEAPPADNQLPVKQAPSPEPEPAINWKRIGTIAALFGIPIVALVGPVAVILGMKGRRRRGRRRHRVIPNRVAGGWSELVDKARDLGRSPSPAATRSEQAEVMAVQFGKLIEHADPIALAKKADAVVFSPDAVPEQTADAYWQQVKQAERGVRHSVGPLAWLRSRLSTKSFRKYKG